MLRKLAVGGGIVWMSPMIASKASAQAPPSQCSTTALLDWDTFTVNSIFPGTTTVAGVDISITSVITAPTTALAGNFRIMASPHGGIAGQSLMFEQTPFANSVGQLITISFSVAVRDVVFTITDIDNQANTWSDRLTTTTAPTSYVRGTNVIGIGATGNGSGGSPNSGNGGGNGQTGAFRNSVDSDNLANTSSAGNLTLTYAGPITTIQLQYWNGAVAGGSTANQLIRLSDIAFNSCP